jgi:hypothetical protein
LYVACNRSAAFARFLGGCIATAVNSMIRVCVYLDKAVPGMNNRHDVGRSGQCIYLQFMEFPKFFRSRRNGWIPLTYISVDDQATAGVTDSMLMRWIVMMLDDPTKDINLSTGIGLPHPDGTLHLKGSCCVSVADWEQHKKSFQLTGFNGSRTCIICKNLLGRCDDFEHEYLVHVFSTEPSRFDLHTAGSFTDVLNKLEFTAANCDRATLKTEEQCCGVQHDPDGLLFDPIARAKMEPPMCMFGDWMHILLSSSAVGQFHVNQFVRQLSLHKPVPEIDSWIDSIRLPRGVTKLRKRFLADRVVDSPGRHIHAFASELMSLIMVLGFYVDAVIVPLGIESLQPFIDCFFALRIMLSVLQRADPSEIHILESSTLLHARLYKKCYPDCLKPKFHAAFHLADFWRYWGVLVSCFAAERHHKLFKQVCQFSFNHYTRTALAYDVRQWLANIMDDTLYQQTHLAGKIHKVQVRLEVGGGAFDIEETAGAINTVTGYIYNKDIVQWADSTGMNQIGQCMGFMRTSQWQYLFVVNGLTRVDAQSWDVPTRPSPVVLKAEAIAGAVPYVQVGHRVVPCVFVGYGA